MKHATLSRIAGGYLETLRGWMGFLMVVAISAAASLLITLPLWFFAVSSPSGYSIFVALAAAAALIASAVRFLTSRQSRGGLSIPGFLRLRILPKVLMTLMVLAALAAVLFLLATRHFLLLVLFLACFLLLFGWIRYGRRHP